MKHVRVEVGVVRSVQPARRQVRVTPVAHEVKALDRAKWIWVVFRQGREARCRVEAVETAGAERLLRFVPGISKDVVASMRGATLEVEAEAGSETSAEVVDVAELPGLEVYDKAGKRMGVVLAVYASPASQAFEVEKENGRTLLLPVIPEVIEAVDREKGAMTLRDIAPYAVEEEA